MITNYSQAMGALIKDICKKKGVSQTKLGLRINMADGRVSNKLNGKVRMSVDDFFSMLDALNIYIRFEDGDEEEGADEDTGVQKADQIQKQIQE